MMWRFEVRVFPLFGKTPYSAMNLNRILLPLGLLSGLLSSCMYPYPPNPHEPLAGGAPDPVAAPPTVSAEEQSRIRAARNEARARERDRQEANNPPPDTAPPDAEKKPAQREYRVGIPIPGKEGYVFNPFTNNPVDVRAIPSGMLVRDPQDPDLDHKFRVP